MDSLDFNNRSSSNNTVHLSLIYRVPTSTGLIFVPQKTTCIINKRTVSSSFWPRTTGVGSGGGVHPCSLGSSYRLKRGEIFCWDAANISLKCWNGWQLDFLVTQIAEREPSRYLIHVIECWIELEHWTTICNFLMFFTLDTQHPKYIIVWNLSCDIASMKFATFCIFIMSHV